MTTKAQGELYAMQSIKSSAELDREMRKRGEITLNFDAPTKAAGAANAQGAAVIMDKSSNSNWATLGAIVFLILGLAVYSRTHLEGGNKSDGSSSSGGDVEDRKDSHKDAPLFSAVAVTPLYPSAGDIRAERDMLNRKALEQQPLWLQRKRFDI